MKFKYFFYAVVIALILELVIFQPSNDREWKSDQTELSYAEIGVEEVEIFNIRNIDYRDVDDFDVSYYDKTFRLEDLKSVDFLVEPFSDFEGPAHTLLSFGFEGDEYVSISVEIRKEVGEEFSPLKGLFRQYELQYVIADERDVIKLRTNYRKDQVYLYPMNGSQEGMQKMFISMLTRANKLKDAPEFYNTLTSTCTTNLVDHLNEVREDKLSAWNYKVLLPAFSGELAFDAGLIDTDLSFEKAREHFQINDLAEEYGDSDDFSVKIRSGR
ncbi:DUF4105 domain-containing protein [Candidatus Gracilibacteria bacterium]|nr:DUF4105 domain-containing protein [Candidatus Gracilibacteria bacterium]